MKAGSAGQAKATLKAKGVLLPPLPALPLALPMRVQLHAEDATCFEAVVGNTGVLRNDGAAFVGHND